MAHPAEQLTFFLLVPHALAWPNGSVLTVMEAPEDEVPPYALRADRPFVGRPDRWWVQLCFHQHDVAASRDDDAFFLVDSVMRRSVGLEAPKERPKGPLFGPDAHRETVVEVTTPLAGTDEAQLFSGVIRGLDALRDADRASILAAGDARTPIAPADVWPVVPWVRRSASDGRVVEGPRILVLENNQLRDRPVPDEVHGDDLARVEAALGAIQAHHPFLRWREWLLAAEEARILVRPEDAVIRLAVAVEVMLDAVLALALWEVHTPVDDAVVSLSVDLSRRIKRDFGRMFGGSWDRKREPVASWSKDLAYLRGRIVHRGHRPGTDEVEAAFAATDALHRYVVERLIERRSRYPKTVLLLVGQAGLVERDAWDGAVRRLGDDGGLMEHDWLLDYDRWRATVDEAARTAANR